MIEISKLQNAACTLCGKPIQGYCVSKHYDIICMDCAQEIAERREEILQILQDEKQEPEEEKKDDKSWKCRKCGEKFTNHGDFLAHCRAHHRKEREKAEYYGSK